MNRRTLLAGTLAAVAMGIGTGLFVMRDRLRLAERFARWPTCDGAENMKTRIAKEFQNGRTVVSDGWVLAESEAALLDEIEQASVASAVTTVCSAT